jgi:ribulose-phosphate 3-epimerase
MSGKIAPSVMCADFLRLEKTLRLFEALNVEYLHVDIMDGSFVPNYTLGTDFVRALRAAASIPLDVHLMIDEPERKIDWFGFRPGEYVSIHYEATKHVQRALARVKDTGAKAMLALNPATPLCVLEDVLPDLDGVLLMTVNPGYAGQRLIPQIIDKIARLRAMAPDIEIETDGNVSFENAKRMRAAGATLFVAGSSSVFSKDADLAANTQKLREIIA